jgi:tRNA A-37 threonylcarbamoyl transferase component Bud32
VQRSNTGSGPEAAAAPVPAADAVLAGRLGWTVRCTPRRRTLRIEQGGATPWFAKLRNERGGRARAEWRWLHRLPELGFRVPAPLCLRCERGRSLIATAAAAGRPLDALIREADALGDRAAVRRFACEVVAPMVRRLHDHGLCFRDLYWNHLLAVSLDPRAGEPCLIDVERVLRPRWRMTRWRIKDLAGLLSSMPVPVPRTEALRFLRAYLGALQPRWRRLFRSVTQKAARIRAHRPRYG